MRFVTDTLPSSKKEVEWYWQKTVQETFDLSNVMIKNKKVDFNIPLDCFELSDINADKISFIGRKYAFFSQPISITNFELSIFGDISADTQIGSLLSNIRNLRPTAETYGIYVKYMYFDNSVYCGITICFVDKDTGEEMETAVFEIGEDENAYIVPISINDETLSYYSFDDLAKLVYWLGNFWIGVQFELNNCPEEIRIVEQRGPITPNQEQEIKQSKQPVLIKKIISTDEEGNIIKHTAKQSGRKFTLSSWSVRGHSRTLSDGRVIKVNPYRKGKDRKDCKKLVAKEYEFVKEKIDGDIK